MDYTLTRIDPNGENDRYPLQKQEIVTDPWSKKSTKACTWASSNMPCTTWSTGVVRTPSGHTTLAFLAATLKW